MKTRASINRRLALWIAFVSYDAYSAALGSPQDLVFNVGPLSVTPYQLLLACAFLLSVGDFRQLLADRSPSITRTITKIVLIYLLFEVFVIMPVGVALGSKPGQVAGGMTVRFTWLLLPTFLVLCRDDRARRLVASVALVAAACLVAWGLYVAATGGGGWYLEEGGELRYRILWGGATLFFAWPLVVGASGAASRRLAPVLIGLSLIGLTLTNHRSGLIAFAVAAVFCLATSGAWRRIAVWLVPTALVAIIVGIAMWTRLTQIFGYTIGALFDLSSGTGADRVVVWQEALKAFTARPFSDYAWTWSYYLVDDAGDAAPHNFVLQIATTEGVAGLVFWGAIIWTTFKAAWGWVRRDAIARALLAYVIAYLTFSLGNTTLYQPACLALLVAATGGVVARVDQLRAIDAGPGTTELLSDAQAA